MLLSTRDWELQQRGLNHHAISSGSFVIQAKDSWHQRMKFYGGEPILDYNYGEQFIMHCAIKQLLPALNEI
jgi:hypothetical protein